VAASVACFLGGGGGNPYILLGGSGAEILPPRVAAMQIVENKKENDIISIYASVVWLFHIVPLASYSR
jgi:hypothetical protein